MYNTDEHWKAWGEQDPYFGVLSRNEFRKENIAKYRDEFFDSGAQLMSSVVAMAVRHFGQFNTESALDFGSGVGRLTIPLAQRFKKVVGVEISEAMIAEAQRNCEGFGVSNVDFVKSDDQLSLVAQKFDFVNCCLVLQHIPPGRGMKIVARLLKTLNVGGVIVLQFPVRVDLSGLQQVLYTIKHKAPFTRHWFNLLRGRRISEPLMQLNQYDLVEVIALCSANGVAETTVRSSAFAGGLSATLVGKKET
jgi:SAM-dependent methyltransferases related to tRNA (uracil-5-)-methyltransferase